MYYDSISALIRKYERTPKQYAFMAETVEAHQSWKEQARARLREITGLEECEWAAPDPHMISAEKLDGYVREYWVITTEPDVQMPFYLLRPETPNGAAVLNLHGHGGGKEQMVTISDVSTSEMSVSNVLTSNTVAKDVPEPTFAEELVQAGFMVFCPDMRGSGDRRERFQQGDTPENRSSCSHKELQMAALGFGQTMVAWAVWDMMKLIDYIETLPEIDSDRIGCSGFSGGGQITLWLTALDERIRAAMTSGYFYGMRDSLVDMCNNCPCNYVPFLWKTMDTGDMGALIAPRPLFIENGAADHLNGHRGLENVYEQVEIAKKAYQLYGAENQLVHKIHPGSHVWSGGGVKEFFLEHLAR